MLPEVSLTLTSSNSTVHVANRELKLAGNISGTSNLIKLDVSILFLPELSYTLNLNFLFQIRLQTLLVS